MGVSAKVAFVLFIVSAASGVPADSRNKAHIDFDAIGDLNAESSEIIAEAVAAPTGIINKYHDPEPAASDHAEQTEGPVGDSQNFFPSFASLFEPRQNNFRAGFGSQETAYSQRPNSYRSLLNYPLFGGGYRNLDNFGKAAQSAPLVDASSSVLGSGNFGIIRGGTFFAQNDEDGGDFSNEFSSFYNNGHGRPSLGGGYIANPRPNYNQDQFANFRDFADINTPSNSAFSHYVVVYANKNATMDEVSEETRRVVSKPKNIIETLERLDNVKSAPKVSKTKAKLDATKKKYQHKKEQWKKTTPKYHSIAKHDPEEPLLALS